MIPPGTKVRYRGFPLINSNRFFTGIVESNHMDRGVEMIRLSSTDNPNNAYAFSSFPAYEFTIISTPAEIIKLALDHENVK